MVSKQELSPGAVEKFTDASFFSKKSLNCLAPLTDTGVLDMYFRIVKVNWKHWSKQQLFFPD